MIEIKREEVNRKAKEVLGGRYCSILAPNYTGKTTFIRQIMARIEKEFSNHCVSLYINMSEFKGLVLPVLYAKLIERIVESLKVRRRRSQRVSDTRFILDLQNALKLRADRRLILVLDEMESITKDSANRVLSLFRTIFNERGSVKEFERISVVIAGAITLSQLSDPKESPFRVGGYILSDLSHKEAEELIEKLAEENGVSIDDEAKGALIENTAGHPHLLQRLCQTCFEKRRKVTRRVVNRGIKSLLIEGSEDMEDAERRMAEYPEALETLIEVVEGKRVKRKEAVTGTRDLGRLELTGAFVFREESYRIRNPIYERFLKTRFSWKRLGDLLLQSGRRDGALICYERYIKGLKGLPLSGKVSAISEFLIPLMRSSSEMREVYNLLFMVFHKFLKFSDVRIFILDTKAHLLVEKGGRGESIPFSRESRAIEAEVLFFKKEYDVDYEKNRLILPLLGQGKRKVGAISLSPSPSEKAEIEALISFVNKIGIALGEAIKIGQPKEELADVHRKLSQSARLAVLGETLLTLVHEISKPLTHIQTANFLISKLIEKKIGSDREIERYTKTVDESVARLGRLIERLLQHGRHALPKIKPVDVNRVVEETLLLTEPECSKQGVKIVKSLTKNIPLVNADKDQLKQVFLNIVSNSVEAMPKGGRLTISTEISDDTVIVRFSDTGCGISKKNIGKVFEPFFTTKKEKEGIGLGMAISKRIIESHNGKIDVESTVRKGTTFTVRLPARIQI
jgi:signal transduction histidine kinase